MPICRLPCGHIRNSRQPAAATVLEPRQDRFGFKSLPHDDSRSAAARPRAVGSGALFGGVPPHDAAASAPCYALAMLTNSTTPLQKASNSVPKIGVRMWWTSSEVHSHRSPF